ncbi:MAG: rimL [Gammaproteobacteria bacterium]|jgi:RimJ/RimL family protein N-acetyltransferase|nr:rimL [Gammaproteobacteria bacterium]
MLKQKVYFRPYKLNDIESRFEAIKESEDYLLPWIPWAKGYTLEACKSWVQGAHEAWENGKDYCFAIIDAASEEYIGEVKLLNVHRAYFESKAAVGYWVRKSYAGKGIAVEALKWMTAYAFRELGLYRVEIMIMPENEKSLRVARKAGAKEEGCLRNQWIFNGQPQDVVLFSFIPSDFNSDKYGE